MYLGLTPCCSKLLEGGSHSMKSMLSYYQQMLSSGILYSFALSGIWLIVWMQSTVEKSKQNSVFYCGWWKSESLTILCSTICEKTLSADSPWYNPCHPSCVWVWQAFFKAKGTFSWLRHWLNRWKLRCYWSSITLQCSHSKAGFARCFFLIWLLYCIFCLWHHCICGGNGAITDQWKRLVLLDCCELY